jgi:cytochrome c oxidase subunit 2
MPVSSPFNPVSPEAQAISNLFIFILVVAALILALVTFLVLFAAFRYRSRPGEAEGEPRQIFGSRRLEISWTVAPALLLIIVFILTIRTMRAADPPIPPNPQPDLVVIAHQWWWELHYPKSGVVTANEVHIPVGQRLLVRVESADVIHDFWVPQLARKIDAIPGYPNHIWLEADTPGTYLGTCAEYCGAEHAWMRIRVIAQPQADFDAWQQQQLQAAPVPTTGEAAQGARLYNHVIQPVGPNLTHVASRETLGAGILDNTPANLAKWLTNPQAVKPGVHMPNLHLTDAEVNALVAYLESQK